MSNAKTCRWATSSARQTTATRSATDWPRTVTGEDSWGQPIIAEALSAVFDDTSVSEIFDGENLA